MKFLINVRNRIEGFVKNHYRISSYVIKLVMIFLALFILKSTIGYNEILSNIWVVLGLSVVCAFIPLRFVLFILLAYQVLQMLALSMGVAVMIAIIMLLMYMIYFRFSKNYAFVIIALPILFMIKIPVVIPLLLGVIAPLSSLTSIVFGTIIYYMIHYVSLNATVFSDIATSEFTKTSLLIEGSFLNSEFLYNLVIIAVVFIVVFFVKKINANRSNDIAVCIGTGSAIILYMAANLVFGSISSEKIISIVVFSVIAGIICEIIHNVVLPLDYTRTNMLQLEDEEYYYYVRAVPKAAIEKQSVEVSEINASARKPEKHKKA